ncbi:MAG: DUF4249 domain-containing protein [Bacteroidetes bacterium]|nr:DUF4249 domain-containing protein [Bacteroidota bacterium]
MYLRLPLASGIRAFLLCAALLAACSNELDPTAKPKDLYVVYGILNPQASEQVIRVSRAFLIDGDLQAYAEANDLSLKQATVLLTDPEGNQISFRAKDTLKEPGLFTQASTVYVSSAPIRNGLRYDLTITLPGEQPISLRARTVVPARPRITSPDSIRTGPGQTETYPQVDFNSDGLSIRFTPLTFSARNQPPGRSFEYRIYFNYQLDGVPQPELRLGPAAPRTLTGDPSSGFFVIGQSFQSFLQASLGRVAGLKTYDNGTLNQSTRIEVTALDDVLHDFLRVNSPAFTDINFIRPDYTNIEGGLGVFGSISVSYPRYVRLPACTEFLAGLNGTPNPGDCPRQ